jgi:isobutyryl-CoA mutase
MNQPVNPPVRHQLQHAVRVVTAASLFDGHDAAINIMRRLLQSSGAEVIHLGHNRSVAELVDCAIEEDAHAIACTSYQGGHVEYFEYMHDLLKERGADIRIFGGGGGTILPSELERLHAHGIDRLYSPDDGRSMGLQGMIDDLMATADFERRIPEEGPGLLARLSAQDTAALAGLITLAENHTEAFCTLTEEPFKALQKGSPPVLGVTGTGGAGKSSLVDELVRRYLVDQPGKTVAILSVDPSRRRTGGALLGDRIRMNAVHDRRAYMRSLATRGSNRALSAAIRDAIDLCKLAAFDLIILESSGIGQSDSEIVEHCDVALYVMTSEYGAATQLEKIDMLDFAHLVAINKFDKRGAEDALRDVRKQVRRNQERWHDELDQMPVYGTIASQFGDPGTTRLYRAVMEAVVARTGANLVPTIEVSGAASMPTVLVPPRRARYLAEIADKLGEHDQWIDAESAIARECYHLHGTVAALRGEAAEGVLPELEQREGDFPEVALLVRRYISRRAELAATSREALVAWPSTAERYRADQYQFQVRGRTLEQPLHTLTLAGTKMPRVALPDHRDWGTLLTWLSRENLPGMSPYTAGVFPLKRKGEDPARMFAGEGGPERTNRRFHYVSAGGAAKRLSTAFDSVTLYGEDPAMRPDIYGKVGNSGVSIATLDDAKKLYSGFDLCDPRTSVSMTINGPAPMLLAFFLNSAIDQAAEKHIRAEGLTDQVTKKIDAIYADIGQTRPRYEGDLPPGNDGLGLLLLGVTAEDVLPAETVGRIKADALRAVRGTVQADILKEDQAQNTCIFSTEFALRMMGDVAEWFIEHQVRNFYSVSISGYHIAEAGANPITQLALTLANGFTFVEYYLARGMDIDAFAPGLSFFFSNGLDPEYAVIGRVARRIWCRALAERYGANPRSQKLKYHIQTSGRSLHAQEIDFNDIRTTLQALYALNDNCNSLHTNAYDEAITTPTEESVRRALAIQLIINHELGLSRTENTLQGSFLIQQLTDSVEAAVLEEFRRISDRGGVLGAMERMYQRSKIQEESLLYERRKHNGEIPIIGVNTFLDPNGSPTVLPAEVIRSTDEEKQRAVTNCEAVRTRHPALIVERLDALQSVAVDHGNTFDAMMEAAKVCSLGQMSGRLYGVGGQYRRNM